MYILKGDFKGQEVYFQNFTNKMLFGSMFRVRQCSETIDGARMFSDTELEEAEKICLETNHAFKIYPVCPNCGHEYEEHPAISRKDNKTKICSNCGVKEALEIFIKYKNKPTT